MFSAFLGTFSYRLPGVPAFVPPGDGLVYLSALCLGRSKAFRAKPKALVIGASMLVGGYALWGLLLSPRLDVLGALWAGCLLWFLWRGGGAGGWGGWVFCVSGPPGPGAARRAGGPGGGGPRG